MSFSTEMLRLPQSRGRNPEAGFQEWVFQETGRRSFMSFKVQAQKLAQQHLTVCHCSSHHQAQSGASGEDTEPSSSERCVKEFVAVLTCHTQLSEVEEKTETHITSHSSFSITSAKQRGCNWVPHNYVALSLASRPQKPFGL